ncbi:MAG TPA: TonB-dependent receptor, partial [Ignavibacteriaceae bacterium]|nr:TonB-dependent receptor [Ignavibacteriaceae bacterium]
MTSDKNFFSIIFFFVISFFYPLQAQESLKDTVMLEDVVITGTKTEVSRNNVPLTVSVINEKQIEESSESALLPVLGEQVPGIFITERGITGFGVSTGSAGSINIRGIGGNPNTETLVLLNGNPQFMGIMGHPLPDAYIASDVEKVEIIRGPASTLYGTNAMGGVVNIITKTQNEEGFKANARSMLGSYNTQKYMLNTGFKKNGLSAFASFNHDQTDGHRDSSDFKINNGYIRLGYETSSNFNFDADFSLARFKAADPGPENSFAGEVIDITRGMGAVSFNNKFEKSNGSVRFFYNYGDHKITDGFHSKDRNFGLVTYQSFNLFPDDILTLGLDYKRFGGTAENIVLLGDTTLWELAGYGYIQQTFFQNLILNAGFRLEHSSVYGNEPVPSGGVVYNLNNSTTIKASISKGFRSPTIRELYLFPPANSNLKPEKMINYEIGILQKLLYNKLLIEMNIYHDKGDNLITVVFGPGGPKNENTGSFSNTGLEFSGSYFVFDDFTAQLNYSNIFMEEPLLAAPENQFNFGATYSPGNLSINLSIQAVNDLITQVSPALVKENYILINSRISYKINKYFDVFLKGENLNNEK